MSNCIHYECNHISSQAPDRLGAQESKHRKTWLDLCVEKQYKCEYICFLKSIQNVNDSQTPRTLGSISTRYRPDAKVWDRYLINVDSRVFAFWIKDAVIKCEIIRQIVLAPKMKSKWASFTTNKTMCTRKLHLILKTSIVCKYLRFSVNFTSRIAR